MAGEYNIEGWCIIAGVECDEETCVGCDIYDEGCGEVSIDEEST